VLNQTNTQLVLDMSANIKIGTQYNLSSTNLPKASQILLQAPCATTLNLNHQEKLQWIASLKAAMRRQRRSHIQALQAQQLILQTWLIPEDHPRPTSPPNPDPLDI